MKRIVYIVAWVVLGLLLSLITHGLIEISYINYSLSHGIVLANQTAFGHGYCALPIWLQSLLLLTGVVGGFLAGKYFWRVIYIEKRYRRFKWSLKS